MKKIDLKKEAEFKKVFNGKDDLSKGALKEFLSTYLGREILSFEEATYEITPYSNEYEEPRKAINVVFKDGEKGIVEIYIINQKEELSDKVYSLAQLYESQIRHVKSYSQFCNTYSILITNSIIADDEIQYHDFYLQDEKKLMFSDLLHMILIELSKVKEKNVEEMDAIEGWSYYLLNYDNVEKQEKIELIKKQWKGIAMADKKIMQISLENTMEVQN